MAHANSSPPSPASRRGAGRRLRRAAPGDEADVNHLDRGELALEPEHERFDAAVSRRAGWSRGPRRGRRVLRRARSAAPRRAPRRSGTASARAGPPTPIVVSLASGTSCSMAVTLGSPSTTARAIRHGSPTPSVTTTSPGLAHASASAAASSSVRAQPRRVGGGTSSRTSLPVTPGSGASRPSMTSVTTAASATPSACPSSPWSCRVRS